MAKKNETEKNEKKKTPPAAEEAVEKEAEDKASAEGEGEAGDREALVALAEALKELDEAKKSLAETQDRLLRTLAEFDNYKKRSAREKEDLYFLSKGDVVRKFLPVFDNFQRAQSFRSAQDYAAGVDLILDQFGKVLEDLEIRPLAKEGDAFDPAFHEAVAQEEKEGAEENTVTQVLQQGYAVGDKVIRHAMVKVSV